MSSSTDTGSVVAETEVAHSGPSLLHGRRAKALAALSSHETTTAIWLLGFTGEPCGAWILDTTTKEQAQTALGILDRRALIETLHGDAGTTLRSLAERAGIRIPEASARFASLADLHEATKTARATYEEAATAHGQGTKTRPTPLAWPTPVPATLEDDTPGASRLWSGEGSATEAFVAATTAGRLIRTWNETESVRVRRAYLREKYGEAQLLPQTWREAAFAAYEAPFAELPAIPPPPKD